MPEKETSASELMVRKMELEAAVTVESSGAIAEGIENKILAAATDEELFDAATAGLTAFDDVIGVPLAVFGFRLNKSGYSEPGSLPVYMVVEATNLETGEPLNIGCGSRSVQTILWRANEIEPLADRTGGFLCAGTVKTTASGNTLKSLRPLTVAERKLAE